MILYSRERVVGFGLSPLRNPNMAKIRSIIRCCRRHRRLLRSTASASTIAIIAGATALAASSAPARKGPFFLPSGAATKIVTVAKTGEAQAGITILTEAIAVKETGPKATVKQFGEVYTFSPSFITVHRDQPTQIEFWNLQPDDEHDFALLGSDSTVLMYVKLPPLQKTSYIFTFHQEGEIDFKCLRHQPEMSGQILVLTPKK
jgi:plastocyanin